MTTWLALSVLLRLSQESYAVRPVPPEAAAWGAWLVEHTEIEEAKTWRPAFAKLRWPQDTPRAILVSPDGTRGYTFEGVRVEVESVVSVDPQPQSPFNFKLMIAMTSDRGTAAAAIYLALGRIDDVRRSFLGTVGNGRWERPALTSAIFGHIRHRYEIAVDAFERGEDQKALRDLQALQADLPSLIARIDAAADRPITGDPTVFPYGQIVPMIIADLQRRVARPRPTRDRKELAKGGSIPELIEALEDSPSPRIFNADASPHGERDPVVESLVERGEAAVPTLLATSKTDMRLTRGAQYMFTVGREGLTVNVLAESILRRIAGVTYFPGETGPEGENAPGAIRRFFASTPGFSRNERALWILTRLYPAGERDDIYEAAANRLITKPLPPEKAALGYVAGPISLFRPSRPIAADTLTPGQKIRLIRALDARADEMSTNALEGYSSSRVSVMHTALRLASIRAVLAPGGAVPALRIVTERARALEAIERSRDLQRLRQGIALAYALRARLGAPEVYGQYLAWLRTITFEGAPWNITSGLTPLYDADRDRGYRPVLEWILSSASPWGKRGYQTLVPWRDAQEGSAGIPEVLHKPLLRALEDRTVRAQARLNANGFIEITTIDGSRFNYGNVPGPHARSAGETWSLRHCDLVAQALASELSGYHQGKYQTPIPFPLAADPATRDGSIAQIRTRLVSRVW